MKLSFKHLLDLKRRRNFEKKEKKNIMLRYCYFSLQSRKFFDFNIRYNLKKSNLHFRLLRSIRLKWMLQSENSGISKIKSSCILSSGRRSVSRAFRLSRMTFKEVQPKFVYPGVTRFPHK